jgi:hypothetical protein
MTVTPLGTVGFSAAFPGIAASLETLSLALGNLASVIRAQANVLVDVHGKIKIAALAGLQASLDATVALGANLSLSLSDPALAISGLLTGIAQVTANIQLLVPSLAVAGQVSANLTVAAELQAKVSALTAVLDALLDVSGALVAALDAALRIPGLRADGTLDFDLTTPSFSLFVYDGPRSAFGAEMQAALDTDPSLGVSTNPRVRAPVLVVRADDVGASARLSAAMRLA